MSSLIVLIDSGDTLVDESTEIRNDRDIVIKADLIPGAKEAMIGMRKAGYKIALVADGYDESFENIYRQHNLRHFFDAWVPSSTLGTHKPDARMFRAAMDQLGLSDADIPRMVMIGNNVTRDIRGANALGITSILIRWSSRYCYDPADALEVPRYSVDAPDAFLPLLERICGELNHADAAKSK